jgi:hypothetical protein
MWLVGYYHVIFLPLICFYYMIPWKVLCKNVLFNDNFFHFKKFLTKQKFKIGSNGFLIWFSWHSCASKKNNVPCVATPLWVKCEDETHTLKSGKLESFDTPRNSELEFRGQNTSHWGVPYTIGKVLKCRCPKWPHMSHLDICGPSYGQKKGRESKWQFDSRPLKVRNRPDPDVCKRNATWCWKAFKDN